MQKIGFIGLGTMGKSMAKNILKSGFPLAVFDVASQPVDEMVHLGAVAARSPKELGEKAEIIIIMVPDSPHIDAALNGTNGLLEGLTSGSVIIVMSTINPLYMQRLGEICAQKGVKVIDCPVSGNKNSAAAASLTIMGGGDKDVFEQCRNVLETMGKYIVYCGAILGSGQMVKLANNLVSLSTSLLLHEAAVLAAKFGIKADTLFDVLKNSGANSWILNNMWGPKVLKGDFSASFGLDLALKDIGLALGVSRDLKVPLLLGSCSFLRYQAESAAGRGNLDFNSAIISLEELAGVQVRSEG